MSVQAMRLGFSKENLLAMVLCVIATVASSSFGATIPTGDDGRAHAIDAPPPQYPFEARAHHWTGSGKFILHVRVKTGEVKSVEIERSTRSAVLDNAAVSALKRWRFKPNALPLTRPGSEDKHAHAADESLVRIPINFTLSPAPQASGRGNAEALLDVDPATGKVLRVTLQQSLGSAERDRAVIRTFMKWHFKPHQVAAKVRIPITF